MTSRLIYSLAKAVLPALCLCACVKADQVPDYIPQPDVPPFTSPADFNYETIRDVNINVQLLANNNEPLANVIVNVLDKALEDSGTILYRAITDNNGRINTTLKLPTYMTNVIVDPAYVGVMRNAIVRIENQAATCILGGPDGYSGNVEAQRIAFDHLPGGIGGKGLALDYVYMGTYDGWGAPRYLTPTNDTINPALLAFVNISLPEHFNVGSLNPGYLNSTAKTNLNLTSDGDVFVTFVHEGAGNFNTLAYFTYPTNTPPTSANDIDSLRIVFPNGSLKGSGGNMLSGNKVKLGRFTAGTSIGFCLVANGWTFANKLVNAGDGKFFTLDALNPESAANRKRHAVVLKESSQNLVLIGMEDLNREIGSDNDFNDMVFYVKTENAAGAIDMSGMASVNLPIDTDGDGVFDVFDEYPNDPMRAYNNYYPSARGWATVAFEDTWPNTGDYDMNDMVIEYRYQTVTNAANRAVEVYGSYVLKAAGAFFNNGFGVQFPFAASSVASVTGTRYNNDHIINLNTNGTEVNQSKAVVIPFNDFFSITPPRATGSMVNSQPGVAFIKPDTVKVKVTFTSPIAAASFGTAPFNQFMFSTSNRGKEIHLPGEKPTDVANTTLFNTAKDNTIPAQNRFYKTAGNMPFGLGMPQQFQYPMEGKAIHDVYLKFSAWASSGGSLFPDWYLDKPGYRVGSSLYK